MGWTDDIKRKVSDMVGEALDATAVSVAEVRADAQGQTIASWRIENGAAAAACALGNLIPGPLALAALAIEIPVLLALLSRAALGVGIIVNGDAADEDYRLILAHWSGALKLDGHLRQSLQAQLTGAAAAAIASNAGIKAAHAVAGSAGAAFATQASVKLNAMILSSAMIAIAAKQGTVHVGTHMAATQLANKIVSSLPARVVPLVGAGVAAALNAGFVNGLITAAEEYYQFIGSLAPAPALPPPVPALSGIEVVYDYSALTQMIRLYDDFEIREARRADALPMTPLPNPAVAGAA